MTRSLKEMGEETELLAVGHGTAAEVAFYTRPGGRPLPKPGVRRVRSEGPPLTLSKGPKDRGGGRALLVMVGEWIEPPKSVRAVFKSWSREGFLRVKRGSSGVIRSVTLFRLLGYTGPPR